MPESRDPLGRHALFYAGSVADDETPNPSDDPVATGRRALFSTPEAPTGPLRVECSSCGARTRVGVVQFLRQLPVWLWLPWRRHPLLLNCPVCHRRSWLSVSLG